MESVRKAVSSAAAAALSQRNDSIRVAGVKLRESTILMYTADSAPILPGKKGTVPCLCEGV
jgi:hypothetical protein